MEDFPNLSNIEPEDIHIEPSLGDFSEVTGIQYEINLDSNPNDYEVLVVSNPENTQLRYAYLPNGGVSDTEIVFWGDDGELNYAMADTNGNDLLRGDETYTLDVTGQWSQLYPEYQFSSSAVEETLESLSQGEELVQDIEEFLMEENYLLQVTGISREATYGDNGIHTGFRYSFNLDDDPEYEVYLTTDPSDTYIRYGFFESQEQGGILEREAVYRGDENGLNSAMVDTNGNGLLRGDETYTLDVTGQWSQLYPEYQFGEEDTEAAKVSLSYGANVIDYLEQYIQDQQQEQQRGFPYPYE
ncbi:hypothetical protein GF362_06285 [Candidatus Dojkabacteria bacterium]|nr:hypothetical protein [Candidatus Dojkabacteria bacterium]